MSCNEYIKIEQNLYGYAHGHKLLESSLKLSSDVEKLLLIMSDMSGPSLVSGFESYLTCYEIPKSNFYVISKTWYASEMKRPGCVWTHTLLVNNNDISKLHNPKRLFKLFREPSKENSPTYYKSAILLPVVEENIEDEINEDSLNSSLNNTTTNILFNLYHFANKPIYIVSKNSNQYESLIISVWCQLWQSLHKTFSFSTGSLSNRMVANNSFDLQVIPISNLNRIKRGSSLGIFIEFPEKINLSEIPPWVSFGIEELFSKNKKIINLLTSLRTKNSTNLFSEEQKIRTVFKTLLKVLSFIEDLKKQNISMKTFMYLIKEQFPKAEDACDIKNLLFGKITTSNPLYPEIFENVLLQELSITEYHSSFNISEFCIRERTKDLYKTDNVKIKDIVMRIPLLTPNAIAREILLEFSNIITLQDIIDLSKVEPKLINILLENNPSLAAYPEFWRAFLSKQNEIFDTIANIELPKDVAKNIIISILESQTKNLAESIISKFGNEGIWIILDWLSEKHGSTSVRVEGEWRKELTNKPSVLLEWLKYSPKNEYIMAFVASLLNPNLSVVIEFGSTLWLPLATSAKNKFSNKELIQIMNFLLVLGFNNAKNCSHKLVAGAFEIIHDAITNNNFPDEYWIQLDEHAPALYWWRKWDKCERLRAALVRKFMAYKWPIEQFLESLRSKELFNLVLQYCYKDSSKKTFIKNISEQVIAGQVAASEEQKILLNNF